MRFIDVLIEYKRIDKFNVIELTFEESKHPDLFYNVVKQLFDTDINFRKIIKHFGVYVKTNTVNIVYYDDILFKNLIDKILKLLEVTIR